MGWADDALFGFDTETTGTDVETARIVQIAQVIVNPAERTTTTDVQLINADVEIPKAASDIHRITTERMRAEGGDPKTVLEHFADELFAGMVAGWPIVGSNLPFDFTTLDRELRRHGLKTLPERLGPAIDVYVLDKWADTYRPGSRKLTAMAEHYGITLGADAHDAAADALAACRIAWKMASWGRRPVEFFHRLEHVRTSKRPDESAARLAAAYRRIASLPLVELHQLQAKAKPEQDRDLAAHKRKQGEACDADGFWPMRPYQAAGVSA
jgi:DNA polymerase-3 subunit epsilon